MPSLGGIEAPVAGTPHGPRPDLAVYRSLRLRAIASPARELRIEAATQRFERFFHTDRTQQIWGKFYFAAYNTFHLARTNPGRGWRPCRGSLVTRQPLVGSERRASVRLTLRPLIPSKPQDGESRQFQAGFQLQLVLQSLAICFNRGDRYAQALGNCTRGHALAD